MPTVTQEQAIALLTKEVEEKLPPDEIAEIYNEMFPEKARPLGEANGDTAAMVEQIVGVLHGNVEVDELVDFWHLIIPKARNVWYNEEEDRFYYNEERWYADE